jgi:predicted transcriptional regulator
MTKTIPMILLLFLLAVSTATAAPLQVGVKAPDFKLKDITGKEFSLNTPSWKGKGLLFIAMPIKESKTNAAVSEAIAKDAGIDRGTTLAGAAIFAAPPEAALTALKARQEQTGKIYLIDPKESVTKLWGLSRNVSNVVFLDKARVCRYLFPGKLSTAEITKLVQTIKTHQAR